ncbi:rifin PIR protein, putative [Plasmodium reichenowi]|uniref:Rifin PIR protein, putative n=1 Tax=Plasmodium reichenowi TaxID=5854 RepID=A0A2P9DU38_PLARE|nr:rifin PIR protein, putative [Plasmodium reichenowi]
MKVHYINILLFALSLNILLLSSQVYNQRNHKSSTPRHTPKIPTTRLLCECELYAPANYDSDPQMKEVIENFNKQTQQRFEEYDERMKTTRQKCKEQCDKEIQKIILKDKLEKQMEEQLSTLETKIHTDDIPTCVCKKSVAEKTEKFCLNCGKNMGTIAPWWGLVCGVGYAGWKTAATASAMEYAAKKGIEAGVKAVIEKIMGGDSIFSIVLKVDLSNFINGTNYNSIPALVKAVYAAMDSSGKTCSVKTASNEIACSALSNGETSFVPYVTAGKQAAAAKTTSVQTAKLGKITAEGYNIYSAIGYSVLAIMIIVLIMVIIYLILRYRRKKKMKKKFQNIKLLEE